MREKIRKSRSASEDAGVIMKAVQAKVTDILRLIHVNTANDILLRCCNVQQLVVILLS